MLTLTPNRRLAAFVTREYNQQQIDAKRRSWETPEIYPLEAWLMQLWQTCVENTKQDPKPILEPIQQQVLWEQIIQQSSVGAELLRVTPTAKNAIQAWKFLCQWQITVPKIAAYADFSVDTAAFNSWLQVYLRWLEQNNYLDFNLMIEQLIIAVPNLITVIPKTITLLGVDDLAPQYAKLFAVLAANGIQIQQQPSVMPGAKVAQTGLANGSYELQAAAAWAAQCLQANPQQIIGIVIPELERKRQQVVRIFNSILPQQLVNISAPLALGSYALIDTAVLILQLAKKVISYADFSLLLRSPFILGAEAEINERAMLDRMLRDKVESRVSWDLINKRISKFDTTITNIISDFSSQIMQIKGEHAPEYWVQTIQSLLAAWGWPGARDLTLEESHLLSCWNDLLHKYCQLGLVVPNHTYQDALQMLMRLVTETPFLAAETGLTKVHVLGVLEGAGIAFDQLWVTGMDRDSWPPDAAPNPFIPIELQRQYDLPRSSPQRELKVARRLTATLQQGGKQQVIFSYPQQIEDQITKPSNLIAHLPKIDIKLNSINIFKAQDLEVYADNQAPSITTEVIKGGAEVLKLQAQCPFKAFAEKRLRAKPLEDPQLILSAADRGNLVHAILEDFWHNCKDQASLDKLLPEDLSSILTTLTNKALANLQRNRPYTLTANYMALESQRLISLIARWLGIEKVRAPFVVAQIEQKMQINLGALTLNLRVDRVDRLADGTEVIIDYKTGRNHLSSWYTERIVEPQLPLYTLHYQTTLAALVIANIQPDELAFKGCSMDNDIIPGLKNIADWPQQLAVWRKNLTALAADFVHGEATVDPYSQQVCKNCKLQALCRIYDC